MKNGTLITAFLDECAAQRELMQSHDLEALGERVASGLADDRYRACLEDGWTPAEVYAAFERRFRGDK